MHAGGGGEIAQRQRAAPLGERAQDARRDLDRLDSERLAPPLSSPTVRHALPHGLAPTLSQVGRGGSGGLTLR
jgi:hypothetical protein